MDRKRMSLRVGLAPAPVLWNPPPRLALLDSSEVSEGELLLREEVACRDCAAGTGLQDPRTRLAKRQILLECNLYQVVDDRVLEHSPPIEMIGGERLHMVVAAVDPVVRDQHGRRMMIWTQAKTIVCPLR